MSKVLSAIKEWQVWLVVHGLRSEGLYHSLTWGKSYGLWTELWFYSNGRTESAEWRKNTRLLEIEPMDFNKRTHFGTALQEYTVETVIVVVADGNASLKIDTQHLRDISFQIGSTYQLIGELFIQPDNEAILQAYVGRIVDGIDLREELLVLISLRYSKPNLCMGLGFCRLTNHPPITLPRRHLTSRGGQLQIGFDKGVCITVHIKIEVLPTIDAILATNVTSGLTSLICTATIQSNDQTKYDKIEKPKLNSP
ncbi:hypothetical protein SADUNF_Sadunf10G0075100 [Salix dunnii]|uniref:Uncharacterized protein n=1 Tax=Salix dunnii TaxID=1413687 RepID=A0A835JQU7_9ROSI|nr:hypothetical protein SADUNF_Sadunf10G0075100 [Salix dunnii]